MTIMTINAVIAPIPLMTKPPSWPFHYFIFYKGSKTFSTMQIFIEEIVNLPFKFSITQGRMYQQHRALRAVAKLWKNAVRESRFL